MTDLPEDQLPDEQDAANVPVMGRGNVHPKMKWIADALVTVQKSQADLARALGWDQPTMSRQLKGKRQLKAEELTDIHSFFRKNGLHIPRDGDTHNDTLTKSIETPTQAAGKSAEIKEGQLDIAITLLKELQEAVSDLRGRVKALEQGLTGGESDRPGKARRR